MDQTIDAETVRRYPYFQQLSAEDAASAAAVLRADPLAAGQILFRQGDGDGDIYLLTSGAVEVRIDLPGGAYRSVCILEAPALLGEMSFLLKEPRTATIAACSDTEVWRIAPADLEAALVRQEIWARDLLMIMCRILARRLAEMNHELVTLTGHPATEGGIAPPIVKPAELEQLRSRLFTQWSF